MMKKTLLLCLSALTLTVGARDTSPYTKLNSTQRPLNGALESAKLDNNNAEIIKAAAALYESLDRGKSGFMEIAASAVCALAQACIETNQRDQMEPWFKRLEADYGKVHGFNTEIAPTIRGFRNYLGVPEVGSPMPEMEFNPLSGSKFKLSSLKGKPVLVFFWASWCRPCIEEMPAIQRIYTKHHRAGLEVVAVSNDHDKRELQECVRTSRLRWPQHFDQYGEMLTQFGILTVPTSVLIDSEGKVVAKGLKDYELEAKVDGLMR